MSSSPYLAEKGLVNSGLLELTETLIDRYNSALKLVGIKPTSCRKVFVDGVGWSPQVAEEKGNPFYLCGGLVNPIAIIISPDQYKKPVYMPAFSWLRSAMRFVFEAYQHEIADVTSSNVVILDFENGLTSLEKPTDLLLLSSILIRPYTGGLTDRAREQQLLIDRFMEGLNCLDAEVRNALSDHRKKYGDLCTRSFVMDNLSYPLGRDFWTAAFGGASVIHGVGGKNLLVFENEEACVQARMSNTAYSNSISYLYDADATALELLKATGMLQLPVDDFRNDPAVLEEKKQVLIALALCDCETDVDWETASPALRKTVMHRHEEKIPPIVMELERYAASMRAGGPLPRLSRELWYYLAVPSSGLTPGTREVLWILLTRKEPRNLLAAYTYDKNRFASWYQTLPDQTQKWVADYLAKRYVPYAKRS